MGYICTISTLIYRILASLTTFRKTSSFYPSNLILFILIVSSKELYYCLLELWVQERNNHDFIFSIYLFPSFYIHTVRIHSLLPITPHQVLDFSHFRFFLSQPHLIAIFITIVSLPMSLYILLLIFYPADKNRPNPKKCQIPFYITNGFFSSEELAFIQLLSLTCFTSRNNSSQSFCSSHIVEGTFVSVQLFIDWIGLTSSSYRTI